MQRLVHAAHSVLVHHNGGTEIGILCQERLHRGVSTLGGRLAGDGNTAQAVGDFVYKTTFSLDGFVPSTASLTLTTWTDNGLKDVLINGRSLGIVTEEESFRGPHGPFVITSGLIGGVNTLEFVVNNASTSPNPHGLRAAVSGTALPIPKNT